MCIGVCSVKCEVTCSNCTGQCSWWCDTQCNQTCFSDCVSRCINSCSGSCATYLTSEAKTTKGPERKPTAEGYMYPDPSNRWQERESFKLFQQVDPYKAPEVVKDITPIVIAMKESSKYVVFEMNLGQVSNHFEIITDITDDAFITTRGEIKKDDIIAAYKYHYGSYRVEKFHRINKYEYLYRHDAKSLGTFTGSIDMPYLNNENNIVVIADDSVEYVILSTSAATGVYQLDDATGVITINEDVLNGLIKGDITDSSHKGVFVVRITQNTDNPITMDMISYDIPFGFDTIGTTTDSEGNIIVIIIETEFLLESEKEALNNNE
jgi:hypothetical protein